MNTKITQKLLLVITAFICFGTQLHAMDKKTEILRLFNEHLKMFVKNNNYDDHVIHICSPDFDNAKKIINYKKIDLNESPYEEIFIKALEASDFDTIQLFYDNNYSRMNQTFFDNKKQTALLGILQRQREMDLLILLKPYIKNVSKIINLKIIKLFRSTRWDRTFLWNDTENILNTLNTYKKSSHNQKIALLQNIIPFFYWIFYVRLAFDINDTTCIDYLINTKTCLPTTMLQILGANKDISLDLMYYIISKIDPKTSIKELFETSKNNDFKYYHFKNVFAKYDLMCALLKNNKKLGTTQEILRSILGYLTPDDLPEQQKFIEDIKKRMDVFKEKDEDLDKILDTALDDYEELVQKTNKKIHH